MEEELTIREHLQELRKLVLSLIIPLILLFAFFFWTAGIILTWLIAYIGLQPTSLVALTPFENLYARASLATALTVLIGLPIILYGIYTYIKPALVEHNRVKLITITLSSIVLALLGVFIGIFVFSRFVLFTLATTYLVVEPMWGILSVIRYMIMLSIILAFIMQIILIIPLLVRADLVSIKTLTEHRFGIFIVIMILSALLSPPDIFSMLLMILPIYGSYEVGIFVSRLIPKRKSNR